MPCDDLREKLEGDIIISGSAGSGKTLIAKAKVLDLLSQNKKVYILDLLGDAYQGFITQIGRRVFSVEEVLAGELLYATEQCVVINIPENKLNSVSKLLDVVLEKIQTEQAGNIVINEFGYYDMDSVSKVCHIASTIRRFGSLIIED